MTEVPSMTRTLMSAEPLRAHARRVVLACLMTVAALTAGAAWAQSGGITLFDDAGNVVGSGEFRDGTVHFEHATTASGFGTLRVETPAGDTAEYYVTFDGSGGIRVFTEDFDATLVEFFGRINVDATVERSDDALPEPDDDVRDDLDDDRDDIDDDRDDMDDDRDDLDDDRDDIGDDRDDLGDDRDDLDDDRDDDRDDDDDDDDDDDLDDDDDDDDDDDGDDD